MATDKINIIFEGPNAADGVSLSDLNETFRRVQDAVRQMASHLAGVETQGRPPEWLREQISLRLITVFPGSFGTTLALSPGRARRGGKDFGADALEAIFEWSGEDDGALPAEVINTLNAIGTSLSSDVRRVRLDDLQNDRQVVIPRTTRSRPPSVIPMNKEASLRGRLLEVNWSSRTAQLHNYGESPVYLRFGIELSDLFREYATRYVTVRGTGRFNSNDEWQDVTVREIVAERSIRDEFYAREPVVFDPDKATSFYDHDDDAPVDIEAFIRVIYEARDI